MPQKFEREFTAIARSFLLTFFSLAAITAVGVYSLYLQDVAERHATIMREQQNSVNALSRAVIRELRSVYHDLKLLANHYELHHFLDNLSGGDPHILEYEMLSLANVTDFYDQIRLIAPDGMELARVNYNNGNPAIVPHRELQNKANRYYFQETAKLPNGEIYISPLDLNVERNAIELPIKPMIRVGMCLRGPDGKLRGVLMLNYLGQRLLDAVRRAALRSLAQPIMLNQDGYYLLGPNPDDEWAFMYPGREARSFAHARPEAWATIGRSFHGQLKRPEGLYTYSTVFAAPPGAETRRSLDARQWKIISFVPDNRAVFNAASREKYITLFFGALLIALFAASMRARLVRSNTRAHAHLESARQIAVDANKAKSEFLARMSHEIRTPMNAVIGMTYLMLRTELSPKQQDYLQKIDMSAKSLLTIINEVLDFSKIESGQLVLENTEYQLDNVINNTMNIVSLAAEEKGLELVVVVRSEVPNDLRGDPHRLGQVLLNLLGNAIKFTEQGEVILGVNLLSRKGNKAELEFTVRDTGIGIHPKQAANLFHPFMQADGSTTRKYGGTGLGLVICKRIVELMGGEISLTSEPGEGSCFTFQIPVDIQPGRQANQYLSPVEMRGMRILAVDDNGISRVVLTKILKSFEFRCDPAENATQALELLAKANAEEDPYRLVITDWRMPGMDGLELAARIKNTPDLTPPPKVVMLTAHGQDEAMHRAEQLALDGFMLKPFNRSILFDTIMALFISYDDGEHEQHRSARPRDAAGVPKNIQGALVLLAEDNAINQQVAIEILESAGIAVDVASTGEEVVRMVYEKPYNALLMDIQMPGMDGYQATRMIRSSPEFDRLPIIAMTAHALSADKKRCQSAGMNDYVSKPIDPDQLIGTLGRWIDVNSPPLASMPPLSELPPSCLADFCIEGVDVRGALNRLRGNKALYVRLLQSFAAECAAMSGDITRLLGKNQRPGAQRQAHALKGVAGNIGVVEVEQAAARLETILKQPDGDHESALAELQESIARFLQALRQALPDKNGPATAEVRTPPQRYEKPPDLGKPLDELRELVEVADIAARTQLYGMIDDLRDLAPEPTERLAQRLAVFDFAGAQKDIEELITEYQRQLGASK
ncbi:MAG: response regulator [Desulfovibrio sp.]